MAGSAEGVRYEVTSDGVALVTLDRPARLNALTPEMHVAFCRSVAHADRDPGVRAIVLTGAGRGFCAGADLDCLAQVREGRFWSEAPEVDRGALLELSTPLVAAVNGPVAGMGFSYMMMADVRFAAADATMSTSFARLGLTAEWGIAALLLETVGRANAADLLLSGRTIDAPEALRLGIVQRVCAPDALLDDALAYARGLATRCSPYSHARIKGQLRQVSTRTSFDASLELLVESIGRPDFDEGLAALAERRPPRFRPWPEPDEG